MLDEKGNLFNSNKAIKERAKKLEVNTKEDNMKDLKLETNNLCESRMKKCRKNKTDQWDEDNLKVVLNQLSNNKSCDPEGLANELFKEGRTLHLGKFLSDSRNICTLKSFPVMNLKEGMSLNFSL